MTAALPTGVSPLVDGILEEAVTDAVAYYVDGKPGRGEYELVRGALRVARIVGDMPSVYKLSDLRYYEISVPVPGHFANSRGAA